jgi:radical SAM/Cys-rich protein
MTMETADRCLLILKNSPGIKTLDITGGAPELNGAFRHIVTSARKMRPDLQIIDRCNLTVIHEPGQEDLIDFLAEQRVHVIASMPCYSEKNVNQQRGAGVFDRSISALLKLNEVGFGTPQYQDSRKLDLVYNPLGAFLPPPQHDLEQQYKVELHDKFGIQFSNLFTMTNMPVKRFADFLHRRDELNDYMHLLVRNFNLETTQSLMCGNTISVGWDGKVYDCDFNQQLGRAIGSDNDTKLFDENCKSVFDIQNLEQLRHETIAFDNHCYGCTAGMGSS